MIGTGRMLRLTALVLATVVMMLPAADAAAGCLSEYNTCTRCARGALLGAVKGLSPSGVAAANIQLADCSIDLWHCMFLASHHDYACAV